MGNVEASMVVGYTRQEKFGDRCGVIIDVSGATATADFAGLHLQVTRSLSVCTALCEAKNSSCFQ